MGRRHVAIANELLKRNDYSICEWTRASGDKHPTRSTDNANRCRLEGRVRRHAQGMANRIINSLLVASGRRHLKQRQSAASWLPFALSCFHLDSWVGGPDAIPFAFAKVFAWERDVLGVHQETRWLSIASRSLLPTLLRLAR